MMCGWRISKRYAGQWTADLRLTDCVETVEEEHVEGMKESGGHEHEEDEPDADHEEEPESVHEIDEHVWTSRSMRP